MDQARWADWTDGLNMLRKDGAHVASRETENFIQALTEIGLKIKLLGSSSKALQNLIFGADCAPFPLPQTSRGRRSRYLADSWLARRR